MDPVFCGHMPSQQWCHCLFRGMTECRIDLILLQRGAPNNSQAGLQLSQRWFMGDVAIVNGAYKPTASGSHLVHV